MRASPRRSVGSCACQGRLRFRRGRLVQALLSFPPLRWTWSISVGLRFSFPLPFRGLPAPDQVCWCGVFSFPLLFAFPIFTSRLSNSHLIFMFTSPSSFFILTFTSSSEFTPSLAGCVCVCGTSEQTLNFALGLVIICNYILYCIIVGGAGLSLTLRPTKTISDRCVSVPARTVVVHLGAFKPQLVATIVLFIYIYIFIFFYWHVIYILLLIWLHVFGIQFPLHHFMDPFPV